MNAQAVMYLSLGIGALGVVAAVIFGIRGTRKPRLAKVAVRTSVDAILGTSSLGSDLSISLGHGGIRVSDPWTGKITLEVLPIKDIPEASFEGAPLRLDFGAPVVWLADTSGHRDAEKIKKQWRDARIEPGSGVLRAQQPPPSTELSLPPATMKRKAVWSVTVVCEGKPQPSVPDQLIDVDLQFSSEDVRARRDLRQAVLLLPLAILLFIFSASSAMGSIPRQDSPLIAILAVGSGGAAVGAMIPAIVLTFRNWRRQRRP